MKTVGEVLTTAREKKGFSLEYVSESLKIRIKYLEALESGNYSIFSSPIYIKGFLKNYAKLLDVSEDEILALYRREYTVDTKKNPVENILKKSTSIKTIPFALKPNHVVAIFTVLIVSSILFYLLYEFRQFSAPPSLTVSTPIDNSIVNSPTLVVDGFTNNSGNKVTINGQQIPNVNANGSFSFPVTLHPQLNELIVTSTNSLNISTTIKRSVIYTNTSLNTSITPTTTSPSASTQMLGRVEISNDSTYVKLVVDGQSYFEGVLTPGSVKTFKANSTIYIDTGREKDTNFSINGQNVSFASGHQNAGGVEITATLNPDGTITFN